MHFFGALGTLSFLAGFIITLWIIGEKIYKIYTYQPARDVVDQPIFFLALVALIIGVQLFVTGFLAEMLAMKSLSEKDYLVKEKIGIED